MALERVERERHSQAFAVSEEASFGRRHAQLLQVALLRHPLHARETAVALDERADVGVGVRLALPRCGGGGLGARLTARFALHTASTVISTSVMGRRLTCATIEIARPALVRPVSLTSSPYWGWLPTGASGVAPAIGSIAPCA